MDRVFTRREAEQVLQSIRPEIDELVGLRADLAEAVGATRSGDESVPLADLKGMEARLSEIVDGFTAAGIQVKGWAPLLLDFPMQVGDRQVLLCWLEGDTEIGWYHEIPHGFAGRRQLDRLDTGTAG